ncbi:cell division protein DedD [Psychromonas sp.]|nr:cell division protein DedD [Psychromonas sp.]
MASQFKNRLVGITILVALVVIFLPSLIDGQKTAYQQEFVATPIKPDLKEHSQNFSEQASLQEDKIVVENQDITSSENEQETIDAPEWKVEEIAETTVIDDKQDVIEPTAEPIKVESKPVGVSTTQKSSINDKPTFTDSAWTIQLGAFQNKDNINTLLKKLNKAGFQVHTIPREVIEGQLTRVFVGPDVSKEKLEGQLPRLKRLTDLNGQLVPFNPIEP